MRIYLWLYEECSLFNLVLPYITLTLVRKNAIFLEWSHIYSYSVGDITHLLVRYGAGHTFTRFKKQVGKLRLLWFWMRMPNTCEVSRMSSLAKPGHKQNTTHALFVFETAGFFVRPINFVWVQYLQSPNIIRLPQTYSQFLPLLCLLKLQFVLNLDAKL